MTILISSALFLGIVHSLAPGHWLPIVLVAKAKRWNLPSALLGAVVAGCGHVFVAIVLSLLTAALDVDVFVQNEAIVEKWTGLGVAVFGVIYAAVGLFSHSKCQGHTHHGPKFSNRKMPFLFLFTLGLSPCVTVLPVLAAAAPKGVLVIFLTAGAFSIGVMSALLSATALVSFGIMKLDHPILEHYGDVIAGAAIALMGMVLFIMPTA